MSTQDSPGVYLPILAARNNSSSTTSAFYFYIADLRWMRYGLDVEKRGSMGGEIEIIFSLELLEVVYETFLCLFVRPLQVFERHRSLQILPG